MAHGIHTFQIQLARPSFTYAPGETIMGQVVIKLYKIKWVKALRLKVKGICHVNDNMTDLRGTYDTIRAEETYFIADMILCDGNEDHAQIGIGQNIYPFSFTLSNNIPSSFEHKIGIVRYSMNAIMERPWKYNHETEIFFRVESPLKLDYQSMIGIDDSDAKNVCRILPCIKDGYMRFRFRVPKNGFTRGENIPLTVNFVNKSPSVHVRKVSFALIQNFTFHNRAPFTNKRNETNVIQRIIKSGPFTNVYEEILEIEVPNLPLSHLQYCKFIDVDYKLQVNVSISGCNFGLEKVYDILIGSSDSENLDSENLDSGIMFIPNQIVPDSSTMRGTRRFQNISSNPKPIFHHFDPEDSPPSYESVMGHHDVGHHDMGHHDMDHHDMGHHDMGHHDMSHSDMGHCDSHSVDS